MSTEKHYKTFTEFYRQLYFSEHRHPLSRRLHFVGISFGAVMLPTALFTLNGWLALAAFVQGYAFAWVGHIFSSATSRQPSSTLCTVLWVTGDSGGKSSPASAISEAAV
jgi:hypothetical protein